MPLTRFLELNHEVIVSEFEAFARTLMPVGANMSSSELRDHAEELLTAIVVDMETHQTPHEESRKGRGMGVLQKMMASGNLHADARLGHGFTLAKLVAEFRALRASVLRLYEESGETDLTEVRRFNESIDEALTASITRYGVQVSSSCRFAELERDRSAPQVPLPRHALRPCKSEQAVPRAGWIAMRCLRVSRFDLSDSRSLVVRNFEELNHLN